jgi:hypothetical protein
MYLIRNGQLVEEYHQPLYSTFARGVGNVQGAGPRIMLTTLAIMGISGLALLALTHKQRGQGLLGI